MKPATIDEQIKFCKDALEHSKRFLHTNKGKLSKMDESLMYTSQCMYESIIKSLGSYKILTATIN